MVGEVEAGPIVEACSSAGFLVDVECEGVDEVEGGAGRYTGSSDGSGVVGDLGIEEDDMGDGVLRRGLCVGLCVGLCGFWGSHGLGVIDGWIKRNTPLRMTRRGVVGFGWDVDQSLLAARRGSAAMVIATICLNSELSGLPCQRMTPSVERTRTWGIALTPIAL